MTNPRAPVIPGATYRVQLTKDFTFRHALELVDYWHALGITDLYAAPFLKARPGSVHGYDVVDPGQINPEIGTEEDLERLHEALAARDMGLIMDVVPNHMCVATNDNVWWNDVLEHGAGSPYARYFDIDWRPLKEELRGKVLLPVLGQQYGKVLEAGELQLSESNGAFSVSYYDRRFPIGPGTYPLVLEGAAERLRQTDADADQRSALTALIADARGQRPPGNDGLKGRLRNLLQEAPAVRRAVDDELRAINGAKGDPRSFDRLEALLAAQAYRLGFWRVAAEQINYRRFFEINDLGAIRIEEPAVLEAVHAKAFELLRRGWVTGLRIDHVDGLREPRLYLDELARRTEGTYSVVEKILAVDERLPRAWATEGTTGYEFLNVVNGVFVDRSGERSLRDLHDQFRMSNGGFGEIVYQSKRLILQAAMSAELSVLSRRLDRVSEQHRWSRDFTLGTLQQVLGETIACFPVYRTYIAAGENEVAPQDILHIRVALAAAQRRNPAVDPSAFEFLAEVLLMRDPQGLSDAQRAERRDFVLRFQQLTGPVMAKGLEDTAFYRYFPLLSLNEVGGGPERFGLTLDEFHRQMDERARERPAALSATSTHDTKRGEDGRARLDVLSEVPELWARAVADWRQLAARLKPKVEGAPCPDSEDEYYIYQTLVGAWPCGSVDDDALAELAPRVWAAVEKAMREAKRNTSWVSPNAAYEEAVHTFVSRLLDPRGTFSARVSTFVGEVARPGLLTALAQLVVKATAPGVPDFFQGTELWNLSMVDPDNRRPVDFGVRRAIMEDLRARAGGQGSAPAPGLIDALWRTADDGRIKLLLTARLLGCRRAERELFTRGAYLPLDLSGPRRDHVVAFARRWQRRVVITAVGRFFTRLDGETAMTRAPRSTWEDTRIDLPAELVVGELTDALTGQTLPPITGSLLVADAFATLPFAVLVGDVHHPG